MGGNGSEMLIYSCANGVVASAPGVGISLNANQDFVVCGPGAVFWMWCSAQFGVMAVFGTGNATCFDDKRWFRDTRS